MTVECYGTQLPNLKRFLAQNRDAVPNPALAAGQVWWREHQTGPKGSAGDRRQGHPLRSGF